MATVLHLAHVTTALVQSPSGELTWVAFNRSDNSLNVSTHAFPVSNPAAVSAVAHAAPVPLILVPAPAMQAPAMQAPAMQAPAMQAPAMQAPVMQAPAMPGSAAGQVSVVPAVPFEKKASPPPPPPPPQPLTDAEIEKRWMNCRYNEIAYNYEQNHVAGAFTCQGLMTIGMSYEQLKQNNNSKKPFEEIVSRFDQKLEPLDELCLATVLQRLGCLEMCNGHFDVATKWFDRVRAWASSVTLLFDQRKTVITRRVKLMTLQAIIYHFARCQKPWRAIECLKTVRALDPGVTKETEKQCFEAIEKALPIETIATWGAYETRLWLELNRIDISVNITPSTLVVIRKCLSECLKRQEKTLPYLVFPLSTAEWNGKTLVDLSYARMPTG